MRRIGLPLERISTETELRGVLSGFLTPRPRQFGPSGFEVGASDRVVLDGEYVRVFDLVRLPPTIVTDWASPLLDGDLPLDVSIDIEPLALEWAKMQLDAPNAEAVSDCATCERVPASTDISVGRCREK